MKNKKRFGIDIDGTVTDPATFIPYINDHFSKTLTLEDITEYDLSALLDIPKDEFWKWMQQHEPNIYKEATLAMHAKNILTDWKTHHELFYISARPTQFHDLTAEWFQAQEIPFDHIQLLGSHRKLEAVKEHSVDIFFEDKHDNACDIAEDCNIPVILFDTPYNRDAVPRGVFRVKSWKEAKEIVEGFFPLKQS
ncbi:MULTISPECIES: 5' nucleotidase, NT5C type [Bacillaceae]|uniref:Nucleotidase n=1 Tax=Evansella alkalicola TaxID=745819 RepID=A0ABS6JV68_9BACI|nr:MULTISPECIES: hypothetical protein [Bacillaceae]MBU9722462.1 hypothetical protein [Bacillus alkalicola]